MEDSTTEYEKATFVEKKPNGDVVWAYDFHDHWSNIDNYHYKPLVKFKSNSILEPNFTKTIGSFINWT